MATQRVEPTTVNASGIARMAGVGRAAVSNWRRRYADFPQPIGGSAASPIFDSAAIDEWLRRQGKLHQASTRELAWRHIESVSPATQIGDALCAVGAWLLVGSEKAAPPAPRKLLALLRSEDRSLADLGALVFPERWPRQFENALACVASLRAEEDTQSAFEYLHTQYAASSRALSGPDATPAPVAELMVDLGGSGRRIFDFTSGTGSLLYAASQRAVDASVKASFFGQEIRPHYALLTLLRLWFQHRRAVERGTAGQLPRVHVGDSMLEDGFPDLSADVVLANPPFGFHDWGHEKLIYDPRWFYGRPPRTEPELAWAQHALAHLTPGGTAVLLMPPAVATRPAGRRIRSELVRRGALRAVIGLPAGMAQPAAIGLQLWVFSKPGLGTPTMPYLLFVDTAAGGRRGAVTRSLDARAVAESALRAWRRFMAEPEKPAEERGLFRVVSAVEVLDDQVDLSPHRYLTAMRSGHEPARTLETVREFDQMFAALRADLPSLSLADPMPVGAVPTASVADLIKSGSVSAYPAGSRARREEDGVAASGGLSQLTGADVIAAEPPSGKGDSPDSQAAVRVEVDDVLVTMGQRGLVARVATAEQVGADVGHGVHVLRVNPEVIDPGFLSGVLSRLDGARVVTRATGTAGGSRLDVKRLTVPVLPIEVQRGYGTIFRRLAHLQATLARAAEGGDDLVREITDGLIEGTLTYE